MSAKVLSETTLRPETFVRILQQGYGPGAWHGPDLAAAIADVTPAIAYTRPATGRHNIAEVALHHAWVVRNVVSQLTGQTAERFPLEGEDWFELNSAKDLTWAEIVKLVDAQHQKLDAAVKAGTYSPDVDSFELVLGVTCHAVYHAGQIQLVKRLISK